MQYLTGRWRGVSTTIPNYPVAEDILTFNPDGSIDYEAGAPSGPKFRVRYQTEIDGAELRLYPEKGTEKVMLEGYRVTIHRLSDTRFSLRLDKQSTIYERED